jgi:hypothetical protein
MADILSATTLLLTLVGLLYTAWYPHLQDALETKVPAFPEDRKRELRQVRAALRTKALPLAALCTILALAFSPVAISIATASVRQLVDDPRCFVAKYDAVSTAFFLVIAAAVFLASHLLLLVTRLTVLHGRLRAHQRAGQDRSRPTFD